MNVPPVQAACCPMTMTVDCGHVVYEGDVLVALSPTGEDIGRAYVCTRRHCCAPFVEATQKLEAMSEEDRSTAEAMGESAALFALDDDSHDPSARRLPFHAAIAWAVRILRGDP